MTTHTNVASSQLEASSISEIGEVSDLSIVLIWPEQASRAHPRSVILSIVETIFLNYW
jgi:hypothetical protein